MAHPESESGPERSSLPRLWFELWRDIALAPSTPTEAELRRLRARWFSELGAVIEDSMRATLFLQAMSRGLWALNHSTPFLPRFWRQPFSNGELVRDPPDASAP
jgi:hypothetical protein